MSAAPMSAAGFDANALSLEPGLRLLEASAGTGKTFALAHLVLRLVGEQGLRLSQILVVTFTEAAAAELRDRIGRRLQQGLAALERAELTAAGSGYGPDTDPDDRGVMASPALKAASDDASAAVRAAPPPAPDAVLAAWVQRALEGKPEQRQLLRVRLLLALEELAAADITTIHGFCRRTLVREALSAGRTPQLQLEDPGDPGIEEVVHAYWSQQLLPLPTHLLAGLRRCGLKPALLEDLLRQLDGDPALRLDPLPPGLSLDSNLSDALPQLWGEHWGSFQACWRQDGRALQDSLFEEARRWRDQGVKDTKPYAPTARKDRCAELDAWIAGQSEGGDYLAALEQELLSGYFHPGVFNKAARKAEQEADREVQLPQPDLMRAIAALLDGLAEAVLLHALHHGRRQLQRRRDRRGVCSFSQLLADLDPGPDPEAHPALIEAVAERYRAALIDEFQDTDPIQWRILRRAFGQGQHLLVMVGDPKQAIYRFRGGDLRTYLEAAAEADERHALSQNRRSSQTLIDGLNLLMEPGLRRSELPVPAVEPCSSRHGPDGPPIELLWLTDSEAAEEPGASASGVHVHPSRSELERRQSELTARHLLDLLSRGLTLAEGQRLRLLSLEDICLLVSNHRQAEALRAALERHGLASRLVSRADVFASPAATCLQRFLDALADPADPNRLRLLAASPLLGWSGERLGAAAPHDWAELAGRLAAMAERLPRRGLLGVVADLLTAEGLARLNLGGRLAADLQQVSELVQRRLHAEQLSAAAAADWLRRLRLDPERQVPEAHQAHSDRADGSVSVITIHRSKGLEFPVVFCPFLWQSASSGAVTGVGRRWQPPGGGGPVLDLHLNLHWGRGFAAERQRLQAEESERERLAYVALTRAQHLLLLAWGPAQRQQCAPLMNWLFAAEPMAPLDQDWIALASASQWRQRLEVEIERRRLPIRLVSSSALSSIPASPVPAAGGVALMLQTGPVPRRRLDRSWGRSSYSGWIHGAASQPLALEEGRDTGDETPPELLESGQATVPRPGAGGLAAEPSGEGIAPWPEPEGTAAASPEAPASPKAPQPSPASGVQLSLGDPSPGAPAASDRGADRLGPLAAFPSGAVAGDCLHRILEQLDYSRPFAGEACAAVVERELLRSGFELSWCPAVLAGLERVRTSPFGGPLADRRLADLPAGGWLNELRFDLSLGFARAPALAAAFRDWPGGAFGAEYAQRLEQLPIASRGFLTGAIDLLFPLRGADGQERWWVLDWKSNWLGRRDGEGRPLACGPADYGRDALLPLMAASHYPLQAHLYLVALHRYLRWRLAAYDPARHLGGYAYVFLRGVPGGPLAAGLDPLAGGGGAVAGMMVEQPPLQRLLALDAALGCSLAEGWQPPGEEP